MSAFGGKANIIQEKADIKKCPLMTQSGHRPALPVSLFGTLRLPENRPTVRAREFLTFVSGSAASLAVALLLDRPQIGTHRPSFLLTELDGGHVGMDRRDSTF